MGLSFSVGNPSEVFAEPYGSLVTETLQSHFGDSVELSSQQEIYFSNEVAWSGWSKLQHLGVKVCGEAAIPHLLSMEAWHGAYLPVETQIGAFQFPGESPALNVACLFNLITELEGIGLAANLTTDDAGIQALAQEYLSNDDLIDADMEIQTYAQLLPSARVAQQRKQPLWIVK